MAWPVYVWCMFVCIGPHGVRATHHWEDVHLRTAFGEILGNIKTGDTSWRHGNSIRGIAGSRWRGMSMNHWSPPQYAMMENRTDDAMMRVHRTRPAVMERQQPRRRPQLQQPQQLRRQKRYTDGGAFHGKPKTREDRWHQNFNMNATNSQIEQTLSLVTLLNKVVEKYMQACIPIVFYDTAVEKSDSIVLQTFFQVKRTRTIPTTGLSMPKCGFNAKSLLCNGVISVRFCSQTLRLSYLHGKIDENYKVVNQELLHPYDKSCRSYILFLSDVLRVRDVIGPQTTNRVIVVPRSTQWKLQEFLTSKFSSDIINLLLIGESLGTDTAKVGHSKNLHA